MRRSTGEVCLSLNLSFPLLVNGLGEACIADERGVFNPYLGLVEIHYQVFPGSTRAGTSGER
jgi:hypothetical protein